MKRTANGRRKGRRRFLKTMALSAGAVALPGGPASASGGGAQAGTAPTPAAAPTEIEYPRKFSGGQRKMLAFPLGGVGAGSIGLGGRGDLREWWIFNRPDKGNSPQYAFPAIWAQAGNRKPVARVLEARILPPYEGASGLGAANVPGLPRLRSSTFTGEFPLARVDFEDSELPVQVSLDAFTPFIPLEADDSGLPVAALRYRVTNPGASQATVAIAFSIDNPVGKERKEGVDFTGSYGRSNEFRQGNHLQGLVMKNPFLPASNLLAGTFALALLSAETGKLSYLRGWPSARWWESPLLFWDDFSSDGELGPEAAARTAVGALCLRREIPAGGSAEFTFLLSWHFPNRTPARCGWSAPKGHENDLIGNHYCTRFADAWAAAEYAAENLPRLEALTRQFASLMRETTLPDVIKEASSANLSTLVTQTSFRTHDGSFHGFEGCNEQSGCCFGNCTHVYAYEAAIASVFPKLSHSLREQQFGFLTNAQGLMDYRELLPYGIENFGVAAADGQMACIMKLYHDWRLSGDTAWLRKQWPGAKRALEFSWIPGGWDANKDGVMEGVQHNTYDVEFIGPNPLCGIWYLGGLRAGEEMAKAVGDAEAAKEYHRLFQQGSQWIDANLFNGEYYIQKIGAIPQGQIAKGLMEGAGPSDMEHPTFQLGEGCLVDQLVGQYFAQVAGLGLLLDENHIRKTLRSIYKYNYKRALYDHECVMRTFALNNEAALVICDYPHGNRPHTPFPYFEEVMTGFEYSAAILMLYTGMIREGVELIANIRRRYDGEKRNAWDEAECGFHYARPMASWAGLLALSGFCYHGGSKSVEAKPRVNQDRFFSFWSTASGWGSFEQQLQKGRFALSVAHGHLACQSVALAPQKNTSSSSAAKLGTRTLPHQIRFDGSEATFTFPQAIDINAGETLVLTLS
ncbi:MAG TPA: GH116 family glycosyl-hydrolase [Terriglobia bacterium]|nr:GH116 family glycosyl-hydrolase [Terriglobia bacterium]